MLIDKEKTTINIDEPIEGYWLVEDEDLINKIMENMPYFDFVLDESGKLIDITPTERPPEPPPEPTETELLQAELEELKHENLLLQAQNQANADRADFHEDLIAEMAMIVYP